MQVPATPSVVARQLLCEIAVPSVRATAPVQTSLAGAAPQRPAVHVRDGFNVPVQLPGATTVQQPLASQQAWGGRGQMLGVQEPAVRKVPTQALTPRTTEQAPPAAQQEPEG